MSVELGQWGPRRGQWNRQYNGVIDRLIEFVEGSAGKDPYNRNFNIELLISFAVCSGVTEKSAEWIYRRYVYFLVNVVDGSIDVDRDELAQLANDFVEVE